jgi:hypothetical protein
MIAVLFQDHGGEASLQTEQRKESELRCLRKREGEVIEEKWTIAQLSVDFPAI